MRRTGKTRRGSVLIEFGLIALILYFLLAVTLDFGRATFSAQLVEQAADFIASEIARSPLPAEQDLESALQSESIRTHVYSDHFLVIDVEGWSAGQSLMEFIDALEPAMPAGNRLLVPLMFVDRTSIPGRKLLRYPGALRPSDAPSGYTVKIPLVSYPSPGVEVIEPEEHWLPVVEPARFKNIQGDLEDPFKVSSEKRGIVALRVHYPFQAAGISGHSRPGGQPPANIKEAYIEATDGPLQPGQPGGPYAGPSGLGQQAAFGTTVRPFRRIVTGQAVHRRELFLP